MGPRQLTTTPTPCRGWHPPPRLTLYCVEGGGQVHALVATEWPRPTPELYGLGGRRAGGDHQPCATLAWGLLFLNLLIQKGLQSLLPEEVQHLSHGSLLKERVVRHSVQ